MTLLLQKAWASRNPETGRKIVLRPDRVVGLTGTCGLEASEARDDDSRDTGYITAGDKRASISSTSISEQGGHVLGGQAFLLLVVVEPGMVEPTFPVEGIKQSLIID